MEGPEEVAVSPFTETDHEVPVGRPVSLKETGTVFHAATWFTQVFQASHAKLWVVYTPTAQKWTLVAGVKAIAKSLSNGQTPFAHPVPGLYGPVPLWSGVGPSSEPPESVTAWPVAKMEGSKVADDAPYTTARSPRTAIETAGSKS